jgi:phosphomannomutase
MPGASGMARIAGIMAQLRKAPLTTLQGSAVTQQVDLKTASIPADVLVFHTAKGARLTVRPSGTEPKIKMYLELMEKVSSTSELATARARLEAEAQAIKAEVNASLGL